MLLRCAPVAHPGLHVCLSPRISALTRGCCCAAPHSAISASPREASLLLLCMLTRYSAAVASFASAHVALRAAFGRLPSQRPLACDLRFASVASFAPAHVALRAAFGRLPIQRPLACDRARSARPTGQPAVSLSRACPDARFCQFFADSPIKADDAALKCDGGCLGPILHVEFRKDVLQVELHCGGR